MVALFKSSLQNLRTSLKIEPLAKPKTGPKFFVNITKSKTNVLAVLGQKLETKVSTLSPHYSLSSIWAQGFLEFLFSSAG